jgi:hypothetical protein
MCVCVGGEIGQKERRGVCVVARRKRREGESVRDSKTNMMKEENRRVVGQAHKIKDEKKKGTKRERGGEAIGQAHKIKGEKKRGTKRERGGEAIGQAK